MGTRIPFRRFRVLLQDHPHACGDKLSDEFVLLNDLGSSPRVWGQVTRYLHMLKDSGIIPTRVGTRKALDFAGVNYEDHPHACGDKSAYPSIMLQYKGSSPRVWGQVAVRQYDVFYPQIGVKPCSMAGGGVSKNIWNCFRTAPEGTGQPLTCSTSGMGLRLK